MVPDDMTDEQWKKEQYFYGAKPATPEEMEEFHLKMTCPRTHVTNDPFLINSTLDPMITPVYTQKNLIEDDRLAINKFAIRKAMLSIFLTRAGRPADQPLN
jgi:hypothetical protein